MFRRLMVNRVIKFIRFWLDWNVVNEIIINRNGVSNVKGIVVNCVIILDLLI